MSNVSVAITADVADLQAKLAIAQANLRALNSETSSLAKAALSASDAEKSELIPQLQASAAAATAAKAEMAALNRSLHEVAPAASHGFGSFREGIRLSGESLEHINLRMQEFTNVFSKLGEVMLVGFGVEKLIDIVEKTAELGEQLEKLSRTTGVSVEALSGWHYAAQQVGVDTASLDTGLNRLGKSIQEAIQNPASAAAQSFDLMGISQKFLRENSNDMQAVLMRMADAFHSHAAGANADAIAMNVLGRGGAEMVPFLQQGSAAIETMTQRNRELGGEITGEMAEAMEKHRQAVKDLTTAWSGFAIALTDKVAPALTAVFGALARGLSTTHVDILKRQLADIEGQIERMADTQAHGSFFERMMLGPDQGAHAIEQLRKRAADIKAEIDKANEAGEASEALTRFGSTYGDNTGGGKGGTTLPAFGNLTSSNALEEFRAKLAEMEGAWKGTHTAMLAEAVKMWQQELATAKLSATELAQARIGLATAQKALNAAELEDAKKTEQQKEQLTKEATETALQLSKTALDAKKADLEEEVAAGKITATQKIDALKEFATQEYQLELDALNHEIQTLQDGTLAWQRAMDQRLLLTARFNAQMSNLTKQGAQAQKTDQDKATKQWEQAFAPITRAFDTSIQGMIMGTQTWQQAVARMGQSVVASFVDDAAKMLVHWVATELAKTAATTAGAAARTTAEAAASKQGLAQDALTGLKQIMNNAYKAASGAYNAVVGIPYVGPVLAPAAAAAAFAAVAAFGGSLASAEGGMYTVPNNMLANIHKDESVIPANIANPMRDFFAGGGQGGAPEVHLHVNAVDGASVANLFKNNGKTIAKVIADQVRNGNSSLRGAMAT